MWTRSVKRKLNNCILEASVDIVNEKGTFPIQLFLEQPKQTPQKKPAYYIEEKKNSSIREKKY